MPKVTLKVEDNNIVVDLEPAWAALIVTLQELTAAMRESR